MALTRKVFSTLKWGGKLHYHGCTNCHLRYHDACHTPELDGLCPSCTTGRISAYQQAIEPRACCYVDTRLANRDDRDVYKLAGPGPWWLCRTCARQFTRQPKEPA